MWWNQQWLFCQQDLSASRSTGLFLLFISMRYGSACNKPCILPLPLTEIVSIFSGSTYKPTAIFWCICKFQMSLVLPASFCEKLLRMGFRGEWIWWSAKTVYLFGWQMDVFSSSLKFGGFSHCFGDRLERKIIVSFINMPYWVKEEDCHLGTSRFLCYLTCSALSIYKKKK